MAIIIKYQPINMANHLQQRCILQFLLIILIFQFRLWRRSYFAKKRLLKNQVGGQANYYRESR